MDNNKRTLSWSTIFSYGAGGMFAYGFELVVVGYFVNYLMTDILMIPTLMAATLNTIIQAVKVVSMILAGVVIDSTNPKWGRYRTWYLFGSIAMGITLPLTFLYLGLEPAVAGVVFIIIYTIHMTSYNIGWTALRTLAGVLGKTGNDSVILASTSNIAGTLPSIIYPFIGPIIFAIPLWAGTKNEYFGFALVSGIIAILGGFLIFRVTKKVERPMTAEAAQEQAAAKKANQKQKVGLVEMLKNLKGPGLVYFIAQIFASAQGGFFSVLLVYYANYVLENPSITSATISLTALGAMIGSFLVPSIAKKFGKKPCHIAYQAANCALYLVLILVGNNGTLFVAIRAIQSFVGAFNLCLLPAFMVDIADYNDMIGNSGARAFLQSMGGTATRIGSSLSSILSSFSLAAIGYVAGGAITDSIRTGFTVLLVAGPAVCAALSSISMVFYKINEKQLNDYRSSKTV